MGKVSLEEVASLADRQGWPLPARQRAYQLATAPATSQHWAGYLNRNLLAGASLSLLSGCVFFVAANWSLLGSYAKFLLLDGLILASALYAWKGGLDKAPSRWSLTVSCGLVGALLALYGQVYQSGSDPYTLFLGWALLTLPWTLRLGFAPAWLLWCVVANTSLWLAFHDLTLSGLANLPLWALSVRFPPRLGWPQAPLAVSWYCLTGSAWFRVLGEASQEVASLPIWALWLALTGTYAYRRRQRGTLAALGFSLVIILTTGLGQSLSHWHDTSWLLILAVAVIAQVTVLVTLLRGLPE